ncbi:hypothetical protein [Streptomyces sp. NPDC058086]|uniref:hypothetical protein n=1 Tax=Streptomyces sp. NPDC058086 TaxID=3346334 RepID=UPI0036E6F524
MRFPPFDDRGTLTTIELEALRSLHGAWLTALYEWQSASLVTDRLHAARELADLRDRTEQAPFRYQEEAVSEIVHGAYDYERHTALTAWRYAAAAAVLGITVLERLASGKPPLTASAVKELCQEPPLGRLRDALAVPAARFLPAYDPFDERGEMTKRWAKLREGVDDAMAVVVEIAVDQGSAYPRTKEEAAGCLMTESSPPTTDPVYEPILEPLFSVAEEAPYAISRVIKGR